MVRVLVFGGTSDGCALVSALSAYENCAVTVCSATEYGSSLVPTGPRVDVRSGRLDRQGMLDLMMGAPVRQHADVSRETSATGASPLMPTAFDCVVDATHPYAVEATRNVVAAARASGLPYVRLLREAEPEGPWICADSPEGAARLLAARPGNILLTTGSKDLATYVRALPDYRERLFVRVLPLEGSLAVARELDVPPERIIAMKGPFSQAMNEALLDEFSIRTMVTKASGAAGGFWEKAAAARSRNVELVVIHRPEQGEGMGLQEALRMLEDRFDLRKGR